MNSFTYWRKVTSGEHMLYASEIAELYGVYSTGERPHSTLVRAIIGDYNKNNCLFREGLYYINKFGKCNEVWPQLAYNEAMINFIKNQTTNNGIYLSDDGIKYKFILKIKFKERKGE